MFTHNLKYSLKILFKNKPLIFWTFAFPIILGTFFYLAFSNIEKQETFSSIDIAVVENDNWINNEVYIRTIESLSKNDKNKIFNTKYVKNELDAENLLNDKEIIGYLIIEENPKIVIKRNGTSETIFKQVIDEIEQKTKTIETLINIEMSKNNQIDIENLYYKISNELLKSSKINIKNTTKSKINYIVIEFYTLIAMTCLYSGTLGMYMINKCLANMSSNGKRVSVSGISKSKLILSSLLSSYIVALLGITILLLFTTLILKIDFGTSITKVIILTLIGNLAGISLGTMVGAIFKTSENTKIGLIIGITMFCCFLSGMMGITMKYIIDKKIPILNKINPVAMITDGFYSLYYYEGLERYIFNIISLLLFSIIMITISYLSLRRQNYDSI